MIEGIFCVTFGENKSGCGERMKRDCCVSAKKLYCTIIDCQADQFRSTASVVH